MKTLNSNLDKTDWKILTELQQDARLTYAEIGRRVGMSSPAVQERVRKLEDAGIIKGYHATVDYAVLGLPVRALIRLNGPCRNPIVLEQIDQIPNVVECYKVLGDDCFHVVVAVTSPDHLNAVIEQLYAYGETSTTMILHTPIQNRPLSPDALLPVEDNINET